MPSTGRILLDVAVILAAAYAGGVLFERLGQPRVVGEIAAGGALGPALLAAAAVSFTSIALPFAFGLALAVHLHPAHDKVDGTDVAFWPFALFIGASLSLTAFPVLARILQEKGLAATRLGAL